MKLDEQVNSNDSWTHTLKKNILYKFTLNRKKIYLNDSEELLA